MHLNEMDSDIPLRDGHPEASEIFLEVAALRGNRSTFIKHEDLSHSLRQNLANNNRVFYYRPLIDSRRQHIADLLNSLGQELSSLRQRPNPQDGQVRQRLTELERKEMIMKDEDQNLKSFLKHLVLNEDEACTQVLSILAQGLQRAKVYWEQSPVTTAKDLEDELQAFAAERMSYTTTTSRGTSSTYRSSAIRSAISRARKELRKIREDDDGRDAEAAMQRWGRKVWNSQVNTPPQAVIDSYALVKATEAVRKQINTEKEYRVWKKRARKRGMPVRRELDDDSEFSWDPYASGSGSSIPEHPRGWYKEGRRRGRRYCDKLRALNEMDDARKPKTPPPSASAFTLASPSFDGTVENRLTWDMKTGKRLDQWRRLQQERTCKALDGRTRVSVETKRERRSCQKLNRWISQQPDHFRWHDPKAPSRPWTPEGTKVDSLASLKEGDFLEWDGRHSTGNAAARETESWLPSRLSSDGHESRIAGDVQRHNSV